MPSRKHIFDFTRDELRAWAVGLGEAPYRADQILEWVYVRRVADWDACSNLSKLMRQRLMAEFDIFRSAVVAEPESRDGTRKLLLEFPPLSPLEGEGSGERGATPGSDTGAPLLEETALADKPPVAPEPVAPAPVPASPRLRVADAGSAQASPSQDRDLLRSAPARVECVMIPDDDRRTACISTQVGCPVACVFCASGLDGLQRNLSAGEIVEQIMRLRRTLPAGEELTNVVVMGMGEPLANYGNTVKALRILNAPWGGGIGARRFTVSTVGLPSRIRDLAAEGLQFTLALSLHAPTEELRKQLIPWAQSVTIPELLDAVRAYFDQTGREPTFEYILLAGVNDQPEHASELARLAKLVRANVNLIPYNPVPDLPYKMPTAEDVDRFAEVLEHAGAKVHVRRRRGADIDAACGQLRRVREAKAEV